MGSAALYQLAQRNLKVLGIEQFQIPHTLGSSHGLTRIIRLAYFESPHYVRLLKRAYHLWAQLQEDCGERVLFETGSVDAGLEDSAIVNGCLKSCQMHDLPHEVLDAATLNRRYPGYRLEPGMVSIYQKNGGILRPERCVVNHVQIAKHAGAEVHVDEAVLGWEASDSGVSVTTQSAKYQARRLVITAGPWARTLLPELKDLAIPERQAVLWTTPLNPALFQSDCFPVFNLQVPENGSLAKYYGFPIHGAPGGFKIGRYHHFHESGDPETLRRDVDHHDEALLRDGIARFFPEANGPRMALETCLFTNSPDRNFILDTLPHAPQIAIAAGFSGHGFKFCSVVGEIMAELVMTGSTQHDISPFRLSRFSPAS